MKIELESLAQKFTSCRSKSHGKKVVYPVKLRKAAASLAVDHPAKSLANQLGVSMASIKSWSKSFAPKIAESDLVPVEIAKKVEFPPSNPEEVKVKVIAMEVCVPSTKLAATLADIIQGMGASSC